MQVLFNHLAALKPRTGVGCYAASLLEALRREAGSETIRAFPDGLTRGLAVASLRWLSPAGRQPTATALASPWGRWKAEALARLKALGRDAAGRLFRRVARQGATLYHEPNFIPWPCDLPTLVTIHDLSVLRFPQWHPAERVAFHEQHFRRGLTQGHHFLTVSEFARREAIEVAGLPPERVTAVHNGLRSNLRPMPAPRVESTLRQFGLKPGYFLCVGTIEPRKNLLWLMRIYCSLPEPIRRRAPLLLVGGWGWNCEAEAAYYEETAHHRGVRHLGHVADEALPALYNGATALLYPSLYEGFGLPPLEMLACGGAVLASTAEAICETLGDYPGLMNPRDDFAWRNAMYRIVTDPEWRKSLQEQGPQRAAPFTWERCARETLAVYRWAA